MEDILRCRPKFKASYLQMGRCKSTGIGRPLLLYKKTLRRKEDVISTKLTKTVVVINPIELGFKVCRDVCLMSSDTTIR